MTADPVLDGVALERLEKLGGTALVRQMIELYLANGAERIRALQDGAAAADAAQVERAAHTLKSSAGNLGALRLQRTAEALETVAAGGTIESELVRRVIEQYEASEAALTETLRRLES